MSFDRVKAVAKQLYRRVRSRDGEMQVQNDICDMFDVAFDQVYNEGDHEGNPLERAVIGGMLDCDEHDSEADSSASDNV